MDSVQGESEEVSADLEWVHTRPGKAGHKETGAITGFGAEAGRKEGVAVTRQQ